jgi:hypothetical protein
MANFPGHTECLAGREDADKGVFPKEEPTTMRKIGFDEQRFLVTMLVPEHTLWLNPVSRTITGERPEVELRKNDRMKPVPAGRKLAQDLQEEGLVDYGPFGQEDKAVRIFLTEDGKKEAEALRDSSIEPLPGP